MWFYRTDCQRVFWEVEAAYKGAVENMEAVRREQGRGAYVTGIGSVLQVCTLHLLSCHTCTTKTILVGILYSNASSRFEA
mgnify:CR=1 FL=1